MSVPLSPTQRFYRILVPWVVIGAILIGVPIDRFGMHFGLGLIFGTLFAHLGIAALLVSWGPGSLGQRTGVSLGFLTLAIGAVWMHAFNGVALPVLPVITYCALGQYLLMSGFYALLRLRYGLRLQHRTSPTRNFAPSDWQFGIGRLMILMTAIGICLAFVSALLNWVHHEALIIPFLSVVATLTLGLLSITLLLQRSLAILAVPLMLVFMVALTCFELQLMRLFLTGYLPDGLHFVWLNTISVVWTMFYILLIRVTGYQLAAPPLEPRG